MIYRTVFRKTTVEYRKDSLMTKARLTLMTIMMKLELNFNDGVENDHGHADVKGKF